MPTTYSALKFDKGMTPKVFTKDSATRIEHFDTITEVLRPFRTLVASSNNTGQATTVLALKKFAQVSGAIYGLGVDASATTYGAIYKWNQSSFGWEDKNAFTTASTSPKAMLLSHAGFLYGIHSYSSTIHIWRYNPASPTYVENFYNTTLSAVVNGFADPIVHSKDGVAYIPIDNVIYKIGSTGASPASVALTLPNANFRITSICESGNFINIVGYDVKSGESASLVWDRDTSVVDLTETFGLGTDFAIHNANLLGTQFFIQLRQNSSNSDFGEKPVIIIKYLNGNIPTPLYEFPVESISAVTDLVGSKYLSLDRLYFTALVKLTGESAARNVCFCLDYKGRLTIAQNVAVDTGTLALSGVIRDGEAFWFGGSGDGAWNTTTTYTTVASYETNDIRSDDLFMNIDFQTAVITCEPLPASGQILLKARKNEETTFTTIGTYTGTNKTKFKVNAMKAKNALAGLDKAKQVRLRLESTVGAVITGFQAVFNDVKDLDA